jgi:putative tricarboxylic transport membrane protein
MHIRAPKDFWSGVMFLAFAVTTMLASRHYSMGSAGHMGSGYFPMALGVLLAGLGALLVGRAFVIDGEAMPRLHLGPVMIMTIAVIVFGITLEPLGLVISILVLVVISAWAGPQFRTLETLALAAVLVAFSVGIFVYALRLPLSLWPDL